MSGFSLKQQLAAAAIIAPLTLMAGNALSNGSPTGHKNGNGHHDHGHETADETVIGIENEIGVDTDVVQKTIQNVDVDVAPAELTVPVEVAVDVAPEVTVPVHVDGNEVTQDVTVPVHVDGNEVTQDVTVPVETVQTVEPVTQTTEVQVDPVTQTTDVHVDPVTQTTDVHVDPVTQTTDVHVDPVTQTTETIQATKQTGIQVQEGGTQTLTGGTQHQGSIVNVTKNKRAAATAYAPTVFGGSPTHPCGTVYGLSIGTSLIEWGAAIGGTLNLPGGYVDSETGKTSADIANMPEGDERTAHVKRMNAKGDCGTDMESGKIYERKHEILKTKAQQTAAGAREVYVADFKSNCTHAPGYKSDRRNEQDCRAKVQQATSFLFDDFMPASTEPVSVDTDFSAQQGAEVQYTGEAVSPVPVLVK
ncbi:MAG: hypothetical protein R3E13_08110 [Alphaproteobacteria bacterium]